MAVTDLEPELKSDIPAISECCVQGYYWTGVPEGSVTQIAGVLAYMTKESLITRSGIVLYLHDVMGWELINHRLNCDKIARETGMRVILCDFFDGDSLMPVEKVDMLGRRPNGILDSVSLGIETIASLPTLISFMLKHSVKSCLPKILRVVDELNLQYNNPELFSVGYCWGGRFSMLLANEQKVTKYAAAHPGNIQLSDCDKVKVKGLICGAGQDIMFPAYMQKKLLSKLGDLLEIKIYPGTIHGFASRGQEDDPVVCEARNDCINTFCKFFLNE
jgi:dienelactone hydrolase